MYRRITALLFFFLASASMLLSQDVNYPEFGIDIAGGPVPHGLRTGDKAPEFSGYDQTGARVQSTKILESGPMVLFFYRGKWCPSGSKYLNDMQDSLNILTGMGVNVVAITPESIENVEQTVQLHKLTFTVIYDCQEQIMKDFDVYFNVTRDYQDRIKKEFSIDIAENNGRDSAHLPVPATFIIDRQGMITAVSFDPDYKHMASVKWIIQNLASAL
jgi:peroxiredoxin